MERIIKKEILLQYQEYLYEEEKTTATIKKYICEWTALLFCKGYKRIVSPSMVWYNVKSSKFSATLYQEVEYD